ncbi:zinc-ribbon domain-containing protein [Phaeobacter sp.]|uniref:zinc-ribbon domain-containing protein n=1 Tax=Phaeobacter sp. TaxID=1902409 RepID=UPI0025F8D1F1|nr:zinc-ribbon domain-containing protein [Phaeobacter sp.]
MRLTCPNCAAQYEVPDDVIPEEGRDVQCSNCGQTWFQAAAPLPMDAVDVAAAAAPATPTEQAAEPEQPTEPAEPTDVVADQPVEPTDTADIAEADLPPAADAVDTEEREATPAFADNADPKPEPAEQPTPVQRGLDPAISDILREEAEREAQLRKSEAANLHTQTDFGLESLPEEASARRAREARLHTARLRGEDPQQVSTEETDSRRGLLPNIDEINSTLRSDEPDVEVPNHFEDQPVPRKKSGFIRGFAITIIVALGLAMAYDNAPLIAQKVPQADPYLSTYVAKVDAARIWLDTQVRALAVQQ